MKNIRCVPVKRIAVTAKIQRHAIKNALPDVSAGQVWLETAKETASVRTTAHLMNHQVRIALNLMPFFNKILPIKWNSSSKICIDSDSMCSDNIGKTNKLSKCTPALHTISIRVLCQSTSFFSIVNVYFPNNDF